MRRALAATRPVIEGIGTMQLFDQARAARAMASHGIDVILATTRTNVGYLADYYAHTIARQPFYQDDGSHYDIVAGLPRDSDQGAFLTPSTGEEGELAEGICWIEDLRYCGPKLVVEGNDSTTMVNTDPAKAAAEALADRGLDAATIGVEMDDIPVNLFQRLQHHLPKVRFVDAGPVLWEMRVVKTGEEIQRLRQAAQVTETAIDYAYSRVRTGSSERQFAHDVFAKLAACGGVPQWCHAAFGPKGAHNVNPTDHRIESGQVARTDVGGSFTQYICDMSRVAVLGRASDELRRTHDAVLRTYEAVRRAIEPGIRGHQLHAIGKTEMSQAGRELFLPTVGHGVGRDVHEPPFLSADCQWILEPGMVMTVEIALRIEGLGSINVEDEVLVTDDGHELITTMSPALRILDD